MMKDKVKINEQDLCKLIHWARRYCDDRMTGAPHHFNDIYKRIRSDNPDIIRCGDKHDKTLRGEGAFWPYAQDGMYNEVNGRFNAIPD